MIFTRMHWIEPESMELFTSRGYVSVTSKFLMRLSVIISECIFYFPAVYFLATQYFSQIPKPERNWVSFEFLVLRVVNGHSLNKSFRLYF